MMISNSREQFECDFCQTNLSTIFAVEPIILEISQLGVNFQISFSSDAGPASPSLKEEKNYSIQQSSIFWEILFSITLPLENYRHVLALFFLQILECSLELDQLNFSLKYSIRSEDFSECRSVWHRLPQSWRLHPIFANQYF